MSVFTEENQLVRIVAKIFCDGGCPIQIPRGTYRVDPQCLQDDHYRAEILTAIAELADIAG